MRKGEDGPVIGLSSNVLGLANAPLRPDGIGTYTAELWKALGESGVTVRRIGFRVFTGSRFVRPRNADICVSLPLPLLRAADAVRLRLPGLARAERAIDLYHATDYLVPPMRRTPCVATLYDAIPLAHPEWANPRLREFKNWMLRRSAQSADLVIAISHAAIDELIEHYRVPRERIRIVPLGVHARWFRRADPRAVERTLARHRLQPGYILHVGTLQPRKNLDALISAYESLPKVRSARQLVLVGKYGWGVEDLPLRLHRLRAQGRVRWVDYVEQDELHAIYCGAGMFAFPSLAEGFGLPLLEAYACGVPVVASDIPSLREVAAHHAVHFDPRRIESIAEAIERVHVTVDDSASIDTRRAHARSFGWAACATRTSNVYAELLR